MCHPAGSGWQGGALALLACPALRGVYCRPVRQPSSVGPTCLCLCAGPEDEDDELPDQPPSDVDGKDVEEGEEGEEDGSGSDSEEEEGSEEEDGSEEEEEEEEGQEAGHRYERRVRQTVQRFSPPRDPSPAGTAAAAKSSGRLRNSGRRRDRRRDERRLGRGQEEASESEEVGGTHS